MRVVVADTSVLNYLVLIGAIEALPAIFGAVLIPETVRKELDQSETPAAVRAWLHQGPAWLAIHPDAERAIDPVLEKLDAGERAAIALALACSADLVLMDDRAGVAIARNMGFAVVGTLGLIDLAASRDLLDVAETIARLQATNFRCPPAMLEALLDRHRKT